MVQTSPRPRDAPEGRWRRLCRDLGVTRVARVTGLDRAGIEVACAVRPGGHVLQVTNGKGLRFPEAAAGAILEAAELAASERVGAQAATWASAATLRRAGRAVVTAASLGGTAGEATPLAWCEGRDLLSGGAPVLVPAAAVQVSPAGAPPAGLAGLRWTSNGMGAHPSRPRALAHALLEALERDRLARVLPDGWTEEVVARWRLDERALGLAVPWTARLAADVARRGFEVHLFAPGAPSAGAPPLGAALLFDAEQGPVPLTAGYACRTTLDGALAAALLEAAQSRLTDIHGAREDVAPPRLRDVAHLRRACRAAARRAVSTAGARGRGGGAGPTARPSAGRVAGGAGAGDAVQPLLAHLRASGHRRCVVLDLDPGAPGVHVVRAVVPGLRLSELL